MEIEMVDRLVEFSELALRFRGKSSSNAPKSPSLFVIKANTTWRQIDTFQNVLIKSLEGFVGYHRFLPATAALGSLSHFSDEDRQQMMEQVISFLSVIAKDIQSLQRQLESDRNSSSAQLAFYQLIISGLLQKLQDFSKYWEHMQKEQKKINFGPSRVFSKFYLSSASAGSEPYSSAKVIEREKVLTKPVPSTMQLKPRDNFAERYVDEIAPPAKMKEYQQIELKQKELLLRESASLQQKFSKEMLQSQRIESTVLDISNMIARFASLLESQSEIVDTVGEAAKASTQSVRLADEQLLVTIERSKSYHWGMIALIFGLTVMLLILHGITP